MTTACRTVGDIVDPLGVGRGGVSGRMGVRRDRTLIISTLPWPARSPTFCLGVWMAFLIRKLACTAPC